MKHEPTHPDMAGALEQRARAISAKEEAWRASPSDTLRRDLALTLEAITQLRELHRELAERLLAAQCSVDTELLRDHEPAQRTRLQAQLHSLEAESRRNALSKHDTLRALHQRLLGLIEKHAYFGDDDRGAPPQETRAPHP